MQAVATAALIAILGTRLASASPVMVPRRQASGSTRARNHAGNAAVVAVAAASMASSEGAKAGRRNPGQFPEPIIETFPLGTSLGTSIVIVRPEGVENDGTAIYYTMSSDENLIPVCGEEGEDGKFRKPPSGTEYEDALHFCGDDSVVVVKAVLCPHGPKRMPEEKGSPVARAELNSKRYEPPTPLEPILQPLDTTCSENPAGEGEGADVMCTVTDHSQEARVAVLVADYVCSNALYATEAECVDQSFTWAPMRQCSQVSVMNPLSVCARECAHGSVGARLRFGVQVSKVAHCRNGKRGQQRIEHQAMMDRITLSYDTNYVHHTSFHAVMLLEACYWLCLWQYYLPYYRGWQHADIFV